MNKETEARNMESEQRFRTLVESSPDAIFVQSGGRIAYCNAAMVRLVGASGPNELLGKPCFKIIPPLNKAVRERILRQKEAGATAPLREMEYLHRDGSRVWVETTAVAIRFLGQDSHLVFIRDITGRKAAETALRENEAKYRTLYESSRDALMTLFPPDWRFTAGNPATIEMFGAEDEADFTSRGPWEVSPERQPDGELSSAKARRMIETAMAQGSHFFDWTHKKIGGPDFPATVLLTRIELKGRAGLQATVRDVSAQKRAEQALREMAKEWQETFDASSDAITLLDAEGHIMRANLSTGRMVGCSPEQLLGRECLGVFHGRDGAPPASCPRLLSRKSFQRESLELERSGRIYEISFDPRLSPAGEFLGGTHILHDVTKSRRLEKRISRLNEYFLSQSTDPHENFARLTSILGELLGAGCVLYNRIAGDILQVAGRWQAPEGLPERMPAAGLVCAEVFRRASHEAIFFEDLRRTAYAETVPNMLEQGLGAYLGHCVFAAGKPAGVLCAFYPDGYQPDEADRRLMGILAAAVGMEEQRRQLERQFLQSQKMEAVGRLAGGVAHDFNNLLTAILGYAELLLAGLTAGDARRDDVAEILKASDRASALTRQLLAFSRRQVLSPTVLCLNEVVTGMSRMLRPIIPEDVRIDFKLAPDLALTRVDAGQTEQVILNLAINARDAMPEGGTLTVTTKNQRLDASRPQSLAGLPAGDYVLLELRDTGTGIPPEVQAHIFEPFFTTKEKGKGTGLGLSTVYGIVKQSGGEVTAESAPGEGTAFRIFLPACAQPDEPGTAPAPESKEAGGRETVLLVEDEAAVLNLAERSLSQYGYRVFAFASAAKALDWLAKHAEPVPLMVTDVIMPGMNGKELADRVRSLRPETRILFMSGYTDETLTVQGVLAPGVSLLQKPFTPESLASRVREKLDAVEGPPLAA